MYLNVEYTVLLFFARNILKCGLIFFYYFVVCEIILLYIILKLFEASVSHRSILFLFLSIKGRISPLEKIFMSHFLSL